MLSKLKGFINRSNLLENRMVLYSTFFVSIASLVFFTVKNDVRCISLFTVLAFLTTFFHENMIVVLLTALFVTYAVYLSNGSSAEGFTDKDKEEDTESKKKTTTTPTKKKTKTSPEPDEDPDDKETFNNKKRKAYEELKGEYIDFKVVQKELMDNVNEIHPLIEKADKFLEKLTNYKEKYKNKSDDA
uniref:Uncharacterized protein n=1 Tax=viral metagenome TaxID=1070528 RepID=A0A6C0I584_9ZZZZ